MKRLIDILYKVHIKETVGSMHVGIGNVAFDSRKTEKESLFIAFRGTRVDGHDYIDESIEKGATAILCEKLPGKIMEGITYVRVDDSKLALSRVAANFHDNPSENIKLIGITGTNGKTTVASLLHQLFTLMGYKAGLISTIHNKVVENNYPSTHTTPDPLQINSLLALMVQEGCEFAFMEVSSHAIDQKRIGGLNFNIGVFTNITHEHLDYHKSFRNYLQTKKKFFDELTPPSSALVNVDDKNGKVMLQNTRAKKYSFGIRHPADFKCKVMENHLEGLLLNLNGQEVWCKLSGFFNAYNITSVWATAMILGIESSEVLRIISQLEPAEGRFNTLKSAFNITAIIDYAHTPDALDNVLQTISGIRSKNEKLITVVGAGGDRDKGKRPLMARIACNMSDRVILTSDNPRSEKPEEIINDMQKGLDPVQKNKVIVIVDRKEAIKTACALAKENDIILVAGKGHEKYQEIEGKKYPFDDRQILLEIFETQTKN